MKHLTWLTLLLPTIVLANEGEGTFAYCFDDPTVDECVHINEVNNFLNHLEEKISDIESTGESNKQRTVVRGNGNWMVLEEIQGVRASWNESTMECRVFAFMTGARGEELFRFENVSSTEDCYSIYIPEVARQLGFEVKNF